MLIWLPTQVASTRVILPDFFGSIRTMRLWAREMAPVMEPVGGKGVRERGGSHDMAWGEGGWQMTNDFRWGCQPQIYVSPLARIHSQYLKARVIQKIKGNVGKQWGKRQISGKELCNFANTCTHMACKCRNTGQGVIIAQVWHRLSCWRWTSKDEIILW